MTVASKEIKKKKKSSVTFFPATLKTFINDRVAVSTPSTSRGQSIAIAFMAFESIGGSTRNHSTTYGPFLF